MRILLVEFYPSCTVFAPDHASEWKMMMNETTVASYLKNRLEQLGLDRLFGVAGDYSSGFLESISADPDSPIVISGNANELCAGFAADGYARTKGIGALYVTYSLGNSTLVDTVAGSYTEQVPVILIRGAPTNTEGSTDGKTKRLYSTTAGYQKVDVDMFRPITAAAERITDPQQAPYQIDSVLTALLTHLRPVYLEVAEDVWLASCKAPIGQLGSGAEVMVDVNELEQAVVATVALMHSKPKSLFWAGVELQRFGLEDDFLTLLHTINQHTPKGQKIQFATSALSKSVISEDDPYFAGCISMSKPDVQRLVGANGCIIGIGAWTIGKDTGNYSMRGENIVLAERGGVFVGADYFPSVNLQSFILRLTDAFSTIPSAKTPSLTGLRLTGPHLSDTVDSSTLGYDTFFKLLEAWLTPEEILIADAGFPLLGAQSVKTRARGGFVAQAAWAAIGYSLAAATGVKCAHPDRRMVVVVSDSAFRETCQALADHRTYGHNTVVFVLANDVSSVEQRSVNSDANPLDILPTIYSDSTPCKVAPYRELPQGRFDPLAEAFGRVGRTVNRVGDLNTVLAEIRDRPKDSFVVTLTIPKTDMPNTDMLAIIGNGLDRTLGEIKYQNERCLPNNIF